MAHSKSEMKRLKTQAPEREVTLAEPAATPPTKPKKPAPEVPYTVTGQVANIVLASADGRYGIDLFSDAHAITLKKRERFKKDTVLRLGGIDTPFKAGDYGPWSNTERAYPGSIAQGLVTIATFLTKEKQNEAPALFRIARDMADAIREVDTTFDVGFKQLKAEVAYLRKQVAKAQAADSDATDATSEPDPTPED